MKSNSSSKSEIAQVLSKVVSEYQKNKSKKLMMVDSLIVFALVSAIIQAVYMVLVGTFPFNSFLSGFFCHIGLFALAVSLRLQLSSSQEFKNISTERAAGDFIFCGIIFFFIVFSFLG
jgi:oligosaccharyltransferase complex subunit epsilon